MYNLLLRYAFFVIPANMDLYSFQAEKNLYREN